MQTAKLDDFTGGWFVGAFEPVLHTTPEVEVAVKHYRAGQTEPAHVHKVAREITVVVSGQVRMCGRELSSGDLVLLEPGEATSFEALTDATTTVVKLPSVKGDKYTLLAKT